MRQHANEVAPGSAAPRRAFVVSTISMIGSAACWGFATVMSRDLLDEFSPSALLIVQLTASVAVLLAIAATEEFRDGGKGLLVAAQTGLLEPGLAYSIGLLGLAYSSASNASILGATEPLLIVLLAWVVFGQRPSIRLAFSIVVAVLGMIAVTWAGADSRSESSLWGDLLIVVATMFAAGYVVISSRLVQNYPPGTLAAAQQTVGLVFALVVYGALSISGWQHQDWSNISSSTFIYAGFSGIVQYAAAFWLYLVGLRHLPAGIAALWLTLIPVFGVLGAVVWLGEQPTALTLIGAALIIGAIAVETLTRHANSQSE